MAVTTPDILEHIRKQIAFLKAHDYGVVGIEQAEQLLAMVDEARGRVDSDEELAAIEERWAKATGHDWHIEDFTDIEWSDDPLWFFDGPDWIETDDARYLQKADAEAIAAAPADIRTLQRHVKALQEQRNLAVMEAVSRAEEAHRQSLINFSVETDAAMERLRGRVGELEEIVSKAELYRQAKMASNAAEDNPDADLPQMWIAETKARVALFAALAHEEGKP